MQHDTLCSVGTHSFASLPQPPRHIFARCNCGSRRQLPRLRELLRNGAQPRDSGELLPHTINRHAQMFPQVCHIHACGAWVGWFAAFKL